MTQPADPTPEPQTAPPSLSEDVSSLQAKKSAYDAAQAKASASAAQALADATAAQAAQHALHMAVAAVVTDAVSLDPGDPHNGG